MQNDVLITVELAPGKLFDLLGKLHDIDAAINWQLFELSGACVNYQAAGTYEPWRQKALQEQAQARAKISQLEQERVHVCRDLAGLAPLNI